MKILKLELQNINSLRSSKPVVIDFTSDAFKDTGLFAITGPTGAGKTTLLDAITIALYRRIPRFNRSHIKAGLDEVVSEGAPFATASVVFSNDGAEYEAYWSMRVRKNNGKELKNPQETIRLKNLTSGKILAEKKNEFDSEIERITRLDFNQFLRSMMLAQGEFASFLKADKKNKVGLLDQIIGNDIYRRIGEAAHERLSEEKSKLDEIKSKINTEDLLRDEQKEDLNSEKNRIEQDIKELEKQDGELRKITGWYEKSEKLQKQKEELETSKQELIRKKEESGKVMEALKLHRKAEQFKDDINRINQLQKDIIEKEESIKKTDGQISEKESFLKKVSEELNTAIAALTLAENVEKEWEEPLRHVTKLETQITGMQEQIVVKRNDIDEASKNIEKLKAGKAGQSDERLQKEQELKQTNEFLEKNKDLPEIEKHYTGWSVKLNERKQVSEKIKELAGQISDLNKEIEQKEKEITDAGQNKNNEVAKKEAIEKELKTLKDKLEGTSIEELQSKLSEKNLAKETLINAFNISTSFLEQQKNKEKYTQDIASSVQKLELLTSEISEKETLTEEAKKLLDQLQKTRELENKIQGLEEERTKLKEGEPCPLCGSTEHPYVKEYHDYNFSETEKKLKEQKQKVEILAQTTNKVHRNKTKLVTNIENYRKQLDEANEKINKLKTGYDHLRIPVQVDNIEEIRTGKETVENDIRKIQHEITRLTGLQRDFNDKKEQQEKLTESIQQIELKLSELITNKNNLIKTKGDKTKEKGKVSDELYGIETALMDEMTAFGMEPPDVKNTATFLQELKNRLGNYQTKKESKEELTGEIAVIKKDIEAITGQILEKEKLQTQLNQELETIEGLMEELMKERTTILPAGITVQQKSRELSGKVQKARKDKEHRENVANDISKKLNSLKTEADVAKKEIENKTEERGLKLNELNGKLNGSAFGSKEEVEKALLGRDTENRYAEIEKELNDSDVRIKTRSNDLEKEEQELEKQKNFESTREEAEEQINAITGERDDKNKRIGEINTRFENDENLRKRNEQILVEIDKQTMVVGKWDKLFRLLGGSKDSFNIYVQRLTLRNLINQANRHLSKLNDRYSLRIQKEFTKNEELNIELIDHYQTGTVRPVETCSGGESFILSLSLALGLSDLASRNVKVESLFIDEGFGTLDDELLDTVLSTLATLQSQGKTIGVISHVEKLKERVSTQIQVMKKGNGVSEVKILN